MSLAIIVATSTGNSTTTYAKRPLDIILSQLNPDGSAASFASLATSQITLAAGVYFIEGIAKATGAAADNVGITFYNVTAATVVANTEDAQQVLVANENVQLFFMCAFTLAAPAVFELRGRGSAIATNGYGIVTIGTFTAPAAVIRILKRS